jgi:sugar lactone lactonase YvrE
VWLADFADGQNGKLWGFSFYPDGGSMPPIVITAAPAGGPSSANALAFAPSGDLWVANAVGPSGSGQLVRYTASQLTQSGAPAPANLISDVVSDAGLDSIAGPAGMAFDRSGNLWLANSLNNTLVAFSSDGGSIASAPYVQVYDNGTHWSGLNGLAFDAAGKLWLTGAASHTVVRLDVTALNGTVAATPSAILTTKDGGAIAPLDGPASLAFDASGRLWVLNRGDSTLVRIPSPGALTGRTVAQPDAVFFGAPGIGNGQMQFDPPALGLPLYP